MRSKKSKSGFTLIEILVVFGLLSVILATVADILISTFKANSRVQLTTRLVSEGNFVMGEIRKNVLRTDGRNISYPIGIGDSSSFYFVSMDDNKKTTITCSEVVDNNKIASESASGDIFDLTSGQVRVSGCTTFVSFDTLPYSSDVSNININFTLSAGNNEAGDENFASKEFKSKVVIRN
ncbi:MAG: type II secretion system protein [Candidatus Shapirobacteria bacterium]|nr:type II secretion system protein [Candidatus Shapirobacteria bacterium]